jgi:hypothetical protein
LFFVGCYRDNEVTQDHIIHGFQNWLPSFNVPYNTVHLGGMTEEMSFHWYPMRYRHAASSVSITCPSCLSQDWRQPSVCSDFS